MSAISWLLWGSILAAVFWAYQAIVLAVWLRRPAPRVVQCQPFANAPQNPARTHGRHRAGGGRS